MSSFALALVPLLLAWPPPPTKPTAVASVPELGQVMPCRADTSRLMVISAGQTASGCEVVFNGIEFFVASIELKLVDFISVHDPRFVTKEGAHVGSSVAEVKQLGGEWWKETGWGFHARLPSGWEAALAQGPTMTDGELPKYGSVQWLFKRK